LSSAPIGVTPDDPAELVASIPALLGFYPTDSLVVIGLLDAATAEVPVVLRADPPSPDDLDEALQYLMLPLAQHEVSSVALVIVADETDPAWHALLLECVSQLQAVGITVVQQLWTHTIEAGGHWWCGQGPACGGVLGDPATTPAAALVASAGWPMFARREDIAAPLTADRVSVLTRRASMLAAQQQSPAPATVESGRMLLDRVGSALDAVDPDGVSVTVTDIDVVELAVALADHRVRDACLHMVQLPDQLRAEHLWTALTRATPAPHRAEPASLAAFLAYSRGNSVLAGIALNLAEAADPDHKLSGLLRGALTIGLKPARIAAAGALAARLAKEALA
jgi:hypothetical protein